MESLVQEVETLESIYGEDIYIYRKGTSHIYGTVSRLGGGNLSVTFRISPEDSVWSTSPKMEIAEVALKTRFEQVRSEPGGIYEALSQLGTFEDVWSIGDPTKSSETKLHEVHLFRLDHIRDQKRYISHLEDITSSLEGSCHLLLGHQIFIVFSGLPKEVQNFIRGWKTRNVDVDSKGKPCKERMMQALVKLQSEAATANGCNVFHYKASSELESYLNEKFGDTTGRALLKAIRGL